MKPYTSFLKLIIIFLFSTTISLGQSDTLDTLDYFENTFATINQHIKVEVESVLAKNIECLDAEEENEMDNSYEESFAMLNVNIKETLNAVTGFRVETHFNFEPKDQDQDLDLYYESTFNAMRAEIDEQIGDLTSFTSIAIEKTTNDEEEAVFESLGNQLSELTSFVAVDYYSDDDESDIEETANIDIFEEVDNSINEQLKAFTSFSDISSH